MLRELTQFVSLPTHAADRVGRTAKGERFSEAANLNVDCSLLYLGVWAPYDVDQLLA